MNLKPEDEARVKIDGLLKAAGWSVQNYKDLSLGASLGVVVRNFPLKSGFGFADYLLFVDRRAVGVLEAKPEGTTLSGVAEQSGRYALGLPDNIPHVGVPLPFAYESTGSETLFRDLRDPDPRSRRVFAFHKLEVLNEWLLQDSMLRAKLDNVALYVQIGERLFKDADDGFTCRVAHNAGEAISLIEAGFEYITGEYTD